MIAKIYIKLVNKAITLSFFFVAVCQVVSGHLFFSDYIRQLYFAKHFSLAILFPLHLLLFRKLANKHFTSLRLSYFVILFYMVINIYSLSRFHLSNVLYLLSACVWCCVFLIFIPNNVNDTRKFDYFHTLFFVGVISALTFCVIYSISFGVNLYAFWGPRKRWLFGFYHPGHFAAIVLTGLISSFFYYMNSKHKLTYGLLVVLLLALLISTNARNAILGFIVFLGIYTLVKNRLFSVFHRIMLLYLIVITAVLIIAYVGVSKIDEFSSFRLSFWKDNMGLNMSSSNLFGGTGLGKARRKIVAPKDTRDFFQLTRKFHVDNFYVETLIEFGVVGLLFYLMFLFLVYKKLKLKRPLKGNRTCWGNNRKVFNLYNHAMACFVLLVVYGFFDSALITTGNIISIYCWFVVMSYISAKKSTFPIQGTQDAKV